MRGFIRWPLIVLSASGIMGLSLWSPLPVSVQADLSPEQFRMATAEVGLSPEAIIVSGAQPLGQATLSAIGSAGDEYNAVSQLRQQVSVSTVARENLRRGLSLDPENEELRTQFNASTTQVAQLQEQLAGARNSLAAVALENWTPPQLQKLEAWKASSGRRVPASFRVASRTEAQWHAIELALIAEQRATQLGRELNPEQQQLLAAVRAEAEVVAAGQALTLHLASMEQAFVTSATQ